MTKKTFPWSALPLTISALLLASCASQPAPDRAPIKVVQATPQPTTKPPVVVQKAPPVVVQTPTVTKPSTGIEYQYGSFGEWKSDFMHRAVSQGVNPNILNSLMAGAMLSQRVIDLDRSQAEFTKMPWEYVESAASSNRISQGKSKLNENLSILTSAESIYGTPKEITTAIWGMESSYGAGIGSMDLVNALSSLAYDGRRREFAESQLISMVRMIERGDVTASQLQGSWAGGMGHTQFIPTTWMQEGVDGNGDGRKDPWSRQDALTSTASYLANAGWVRGLQPFYEVRLPAGFDFSQLNTKRSLDAWKVSGLVSTSGEYFGGAHEAELWLPAGQYGPALLLTKNFDVIRVYNNSSSYALGVSLLAKQIAGGSGLIQSWPRHEQPLSRSQILTLQRNLTTQGFDTQGIDGVAGSNTRRAFARWQAANGQVPDGFISQRTAGNLIW
ncbi:lytic murein transglycosylase [Moraxella catarrhalis]|uniref:Membrane-bound lytic murein transglycosylase B n=1 Tax=Moraxella catarrhalis TaxID=480 RepID=A0A198UE23_MORCA|nr:lytic murein transglycosylase [Moraxella catarrhalis]OAU94366.1 Membrane-bound lytic murein transglycosylase B precursor [Moraxella catarrhalis]OAU94666.1 Membrane-bound lytic murein transglycosylase B precursor [Moraxella catarrhalis]OAU97034.1 Membrane-bound lytic murein transglycosylase B precursor [Moraxella catarrhalis]